VVQDVVGTWEIVVAAIDKPVLTPDVLNMGWWVDAHVARGATAAMGSAVAADMLEWFRTQFGLLETQKAEADGSVDWDHLMALAAESPPGANGVMFLPHFSGSTIPVPDPDSRGVFVGLRNTTTRGDMLRAVIEGLNFQFLEILQGVQTALKVTPEKFVAVGGGAQNAFWMQNKADMVGRPIETPDIEEATPLGAAILAGIGVGLYADEDDALARTYRPGKVYEPNTDLTPMYAERFELYKQLYPATKPINQKLV
jgi:xylulokinase